MAGTPILIQPDSSRFQYALLSHKGFVRSNNEDRLSVREFITNDSKQEPVLLAVLSDGVGGHHAGEVAAQIGVEKTGEAIANCESLNDQVEILHSAVIAANKAVLETATENPELEGMAATCVCALIRNNTLFIANLGDSRAYLLRKGKLLQLTYDHTWLEETTGMNMGGFSSLTREHPLAHVLSRYLGTPHPANVDLRLRIRKSAKEDETRNQGLVLENEDKLLLCSDGLTDLLKEKEIAERLCGDSPIKDAQRLVLGALQKGGHDNVSVIVVSNL
ncbi:MAG TPA: protein phosphatase 2C domain-containing protein [Pelolinea sp.]|nr:protein phosphatase 2C domain-containing protein [Pelolinea sp.]